MVAHWAHSWMIRLVWPVIEWQGLVTHTHTQTLQKVISAHLCIKTSHANTNTVRHAGWIQTANAYTDLPSECFPSLHPRVFTGIRDNERSEEWDRHAEITCPMLMRNIDRIMLFQFVAGWLGSNRASGLQSVFVFLFTWFGSHISHKI